MLGKVNVVLGYVVGNRYHDSYWHNNFEVLGESPHGEVVVRDLDSGQERTHRTRNGRKTIPAGFGCPRNGCNGCLPKD